MKLWIIYSKVVLNPNKNNAISWMVDEANACGFDAEVLFAEDIIIEASDKLNIYYKGELQDYPDLVLTRCYDLHLLKQLELAGLPVFNSSQAMRNCHDKWTTHQELSKHGIPSPRTLFSEHPVTFEDIEKILKLPFIIKDIYGAKGEHVYLINDEKEFYQAVDECDHPIFQEYIKASFGKDIRVHVIGDEAVTSVLRKSHSGFKSNFSQGGYAENYEPDEIVKKLAIDSTKALGLDFSGVDILFTENGYTVCEVNGVPGFRTVGLTSKFNIPYAMMDYLRRQSC
ncbi:RimK family alpha-L-glutamate ligase [Acidaminobacter sp. JC074]|uniref:ATP-grasp domain-containing protein n=1 Tax=Acidaminobacter sp. JC074 TaxID=2530199 RepID=UPI001F0CF74B|nr:RimK family alpha-L-glutamate ligase [Acidaminobacter sp. JC074]